MNDFLKIGECYKCNIYESIWETPLLSDSDSERPILTMSDSIGALSPGDIFLLLEHQPIIRPLPRHLEYTDCTDNFKIFANDKIGWIVVGPKQIEMIFKNIL